MPEDREQDNVRVGNDEEAVAHRQLGSRVDHDSLKPSVQKAHQDMLKPIPVCSRRKGWASRPEESSLVYW
jgi:hypothetical protein